MMTEKQKQANRESVKRWRLAHPEKRKAYHMKYHLKYGLVCVCPDCQAEWMSSELETDFCPKCGQKVK